MKTVKATSMGFYIKLRNAGEVFEVPADMTGSWFENADGSEPVREAKKEGNTFSEMAKSRPTSFTEHITKAKK